MTKFKKLALASAFAAFAITSAQAATEATLFPPLQPTTENVAGVTTETYLIDSLSAGTPRIAGDDFVDDYMLWLQDSQDLDVSFYVQPNTVQSGRKFVPGVSFTGFTLLDATGSMAFAPADYDANTGFMTADWTLHTGVYYLEITGTIGADGGSYGGEVTAVPVPEPTGWALMMAGLGAVGMLARRRKNLG